MKHLIYCSFLSQQRMTCKKDGRTDSWPIVLSCLLLHASFWWLLSLSALASEVRSSVLCELWTLSNNGAISPSIYDAVLTCYTIYVLPTHTHTNTNSHVILILVLFFLCFFFSILSLVLVPWKPCSSIGLLVSSMLLKVTFYGSIIQDK